MKLNLKQLETFIWVADLGSFRRTAERLNTTQPNISSRIASLEEALGITLMERDAGSVRLTARGQELLEKARQVMRSVDDFVEAADSKGLYQDRIRVGVTEMVAHTWLDDFLKEFKQRYPNVMLELSVDLATNLERELVDRTLDLTFQSGPFAHQVSGNLELGSFPMVWVASPNMGLPKTKQIGHTDFQKFPIITHAKNTIAYQEVSEHFSRLFGGSSNSVRLSPSSNLLVAVKMVADGYGIGALLEPLVQKQLTSGELIQLSYAWHPKKLAFFARFDQHNSGKLIKDAGNIAQKISTDFASQFAIR